MQQLEISPSTEVKKTTKGRNHNLHFIIKRLLRRNNELKGKLAKDPNGHDQTTKSVNQIPETQFKSKNQKSKRKQSTDTQLLPPTKKFRRMLPDPTTSIESQRTPPFDPQIEAHDSPDHTGDTPPSQSPIKKRKIDLHLSAKEATLINPGDFRLTKITKVDNGNPSLCSKALVNLSQKLGPKETIITFDNMLCFKNVNKIWASFVTRSHKSTPKKIDKPTPIIDKEEELAKEEATNTTFQLLITTKLHNYSESSIIQLIERELDPTILDLIVIKPMIIRSSGKVAMATVETNNMDLHPKKNSHQQPIHRRINRLHRIPKKLLYH
eukprot:TRINITY_DN1460_c0_g1_i7.p1 TRINITY_DN1460_c0_g1~~TRINITY_DN1460_c0_g1_i7.p1  ORF type:complete len:324 (-),score=46.34 TRINITY_DN1460_c0_g1_i7:4439-5410(-)